MLCFFVLFSTFPLFLAYETCAVADPVIGHGQMAITRESIIEACIRLKKFTTFFAPHFLSLSLVFHPKAMNKEIVPITHEFFRDLLYFLQQFALIVKVVSLSAKLPQMKHCFWWVSRIQPPDYLFAFIFRCSVEVTLWKFGLRSNGILCYEYTITKRAL